MTIEVYQSSYAGSDYNIMEYEGLELAQFFSQSSHFTIIDSYTSHWWSNRPYDGDGEEPEAIYTGHRYKGDPIADTEARPGGSGGPYNVWHDVNDVGKTNDWFVFQCETTIHSSYSLPKWQCKVQWTDAVGFDDVSGLDYGQEGEDRILLWRFAPYGGWDLADSNPDFDPTGPSYKSSDNYQMYVGHGGTGDDTRWFFVIDDGQLVRFSRRNEDAFDMIYGFSHMGDIYPITGQSNQPMPRVFKHNNRAKLNTVGNNGNLPEDVYVTGPSTGYGGLCFEDESGNWLHRGFVLPNGQRMINYDSQPNRHAIAGGNFQMDVLPYYLIPYGAPKKGCIGTIPLVGRAYMPGFMLTDSQNLLCTVDGYGCCILWDGSTALSF